jgi:hypothetical protein
VASHHPYLQEALRQLRDYGMLLVQDPLLPCVSRIVAGGPIRGSWLANPSAHDTYNVLTALEEHPDVLQTKLVSGKVTMVHRSLWPAVLAVATARAPWQLENLTPLQKWLLDYVDAHGSLQTDIVPLPTGGARKRVPDAARDVERRLLAHGSEVHTPSGAHAKVLQTWSRWLVETSFDAEIPPETRGRQQLEQVLERMNQEFAATARLPWKGLSFHLSC